MVSDMTHGIMFHHFHDENKHIVGQGSISAEIFEKVLDYISHEYNILNAETFLSMSQAGTLKTTDTCITFDDGLLCQYDIAYPILRKWGLTAFWFVYTSPLDGVMEKLEIYRHFRFSEYSDIENFYENFFAVVRDIEPNAYAVLDSYNPNEHYLECPFYTPNDKRFRFLRDDVLGQKIYYSIMDKMIEESTYNVEHNSKLLWMNANEIKELSNHGHVIGLHSHTHPTVMGNMSYTEQMAEYSTNKKCLEKIIDKEVVSVSYPCNSYNDDTLRCMKELGIKIGFRANMADEFLGMNQYEFPREDHANIVRKAFV